MATPLLKYFIGVGQPGADAEGYIVLNDISTLVPKTDVGGAPAALGTQSNGSGTAIALANHVHPTTGLWVGGGKLTVSTTAPSTPSLNDIWIDIS